MSFDPAAFGLAVGQDVKARIEAALGPIAPRLAALERAVSDQPKPLTAEDLIAQLKQYIDGAIAAAFAAIPVPKDGAPGRDGVDGKDGRDGADGKPGERGEKGERGEDGAIGPKGDPGEPGARGERGEAGVGIQDFAFHDGVLRFRLSDGSVVDCGSVIGPKGDTGERGPEGPAGKLPQVKDWSDAVHYEGDVVTHRGSTYQALRDTAKEPPHQDWRCVSAAGRDGTDGRSFVIRGTWAETEEYKALDVVALNGASFAARKDAPGPCPGPDWQLIASQGKQGKPGIQGPAGVGIQGKAGLSVVGLSVDAEGQLTLTNGDGSTVTCDLYPLLSRLGG